jgi:ABC-type phosphate/phosphonate transport system permease subunit
LEASRIRAQTVAAAFLIILMGVILAFIFIYLFIDIYVHTGKEEEKI